MTIVYTKKKFPPEPFADDYEKMQYYRELYEGNHEDIFPRAQDIGNQTKVAARNLTVKRNNNRYSIKGKLIDKSSTQHYVIVNLASSIAELPADLINRSLGNISADEEVDKAYLDFIAAVVKTSKVKSKLWAAIVSHQVDGGVAYRIRRTEAKGVWFEWKEADMYFEHEDGLGADVSWLEERGDESYLRVERQRLSNGNLYLTQHVFLMNGTEVDEEQDYEQYKLDHQLTEPASFEVKNMNELMCGYLANDETLSQPRGRSGLRNVDVIQEEVNWTITRDSIVFEKHGKPKLAIPSRLWETVAGKNNKDYGGRFVRNSDIEVVSYDEKNGAVPMYITWNAQTEQSFKHVSRLIEYMMAVSKTAATAVGLGSASGSMSAKAILYEWIQSVIKSEAIRDKFDEAIKDALRKCALLENSLGNTSFKVADPIIDWRDMLPKAQSETGEEASKKYSDGVQSLEATVREIHPTWSEKAIADEIRKIQDEQVVNSMNPTFTQPPRTRIGEGNE
ncbi:phage portal protein [Planomicrobium sp. MB-3u-38]|uniref:phage portal protein n=1 Tax=Planomicrobium sp. MB-3u-38 TaxID=2058318 RepID=UPI000C7CD342|nr:phage portal protein [Planomicrobium sp. MB-3u-38]PKH09852.1 hypothetical protein CXF70_11610 [Planomicrobium sp. MB-3u-38]